MKVANFKIFAAQLRELLEQLSNIQTTRETFSEKLTVVVSIFTLVVDNLKILFLDEYFRTGQFIESVLNKIDEMLFDSTRKYDEYNSVQRLDPETKRIYRKLQSFLPHVKRCIEQKLITKLEPRRSSRLKASV